MRAFGLLFIVMAIIIVISVRVPPSHSDNRGNGSNNSSGYGDRGGAKAAYADFLKLNTHQSTSNQWQVVAYE